MAEVVVVFLIGKELGRMKFSKSSKNDYKLRLFCINLD